MVLKRMWDKNIKRIKTSLFNIFKNAKKRYYYRRGTWSFLIFFRILVLNDIDCYKALGHIHLEFKPLVSRFKDYIANTPRKCLQNYSYNSFL